MVTNTDGSCITGWLNKATTGFPRTAEDRATVTALHQDNLRMEC